MLPADSLLILQDLMFLSPDHFVVPELVLSVVGLLVHQVFLGLLDILSEDLLEVLLSHVVLLVQSLVVLDESV